MLDACSRKRVKVNHPITTAHHKTPPNFQRRTKWAHGPKRKLSQLTGGEMAILLYAPRTIYVKLKTQQCGLSLKALSAIGTLISSFASNVEETSKKQPYGLWRLYQKREQHKTADQAKGSKALDCTTGETMPPRPATPAGKARPVSAPALRVKRNSTYNITITRWTLLQW